MSFARGMTGVTGGNGKTCSMPIRDLAVHWDRERALALLKLIKEDRTDDITKNLCTPTGMRPVTATRPSSSTSTRTASAR